MLISQSDWEICTDILNAIKAAIDRLPKATDESPLPADGINMVIACNRVTQRVIDGLRSSKKIMSSLNDAITRLGYDSIFVSNTDTEETFLLAGRN